MAKLCGSDKLCGCHPRCRHFIRGGDPPVLQPEKVLALEPVMGILTDYAHDFDASGLEIDEACGIHGVKPIPNIECSCSGQRYSFAEGIETLGIEIRAAKMRSRPAGEPNRKRDGHKRLSLAS